MTWAHGRIVVGVDGSLASLEALRRAVDVARLHQAPLTAALVWGPEVVSFNTVDFSVNSVELVREGRKRISAAFADARGGEPADVRVSTQVHASEGNAGRVLTWLTDRESDLLVIGSSRGGWFSGLRPSSVGRYCLRHARCAVLVAPLPEFARSVGDTSLRAKRFVRSILTS